MVEGCYNLKQWKMTQTSGVVECSRWAQSVCEAILTAAKAEVGIARMQYSIKQSTRPGTEQVDRVEIVLSVKAP